MAGESRAVLVPGGDVLMGTDAPGGYPADGEGPVHRVRLRPFLIDPHAVTNARFAEFAGATGHVTDAERYGWSFVFAACCPTTSRRRARWCTPRGGGRSSAPTGATPRDRSRTLADRPDHPVVHVSWNDAAGVLRLGRGAPSHRGRVGARGARRPGGAALPLGRRARARRRAPHERLPGDASRSRTRCADGHAGTAPVGAFPPNGFGLHEMTGNVWEWVADWFDPGYYAVSPADDPRGPAGAPTA